MNMHPNIDKPAPPPRATTMSWIIMVAALLICVTSAQASPLRLHTGNVDPLDSGAHLPQAGRSDSYFYGFLQFTGPVKQEWKREVRGLGVELLDYVPDHAFLARMKSGAASAAKGLDFVRAIMPLAPEHVISAAVREKALEAGSGSIDVLVRMFEGESANTLCRQVEEMGGTVKGRSTASGSEYVSVFLPVSMLGELSEIYGVRWLDVTNPITSRNNNAGLVAGSRAVGADLGYYGEGQTVTVLDQGLCKGAIDDTMHPDFSDGHGGTRIKTLVAAPFNKSGDLYDTGDGHGTHVAGTVLGNGAMSGAQPSNDVFPAGCYAGIAPKALLAFQASCSENTVVSPEDYVATYEQARDFGTTISTTSLGFDGSLSFLLDEFLHDNQGLLAITAAGNSGNDLNLDGIIDPASIPGDAKGKNVISVGASENLNQNFTQAWIDSHHPFGQFSWILADPIASDLTTNSTMGVAAFSSRGPTSDGRYKPDILAPASMVVSLKDSWTLENPYSAKGGTSMAAPQAAGAAALIREYLAREHEMDAPSAALMKAILVNSARNVSPGQYGAGSHLEVPSLPNGVCGWGVLNLREAIAPGPPFDVHYHDMSGDPLATGDKREFSFRVADGGQPLKAHLVWMDNAGSEVSAGALVNDLDLRAKSPSGSVHHPDNARLPLREAPFFSYASDGGSFTFEEMGKTLFMEIPAIPTDAAGVFEIAVSLAAPLEEKTFVLFMLAELTGHDEIIEIKGGPASFPAGSTELVLRGILPARSVPGRTMLLGLRSSKSLEYATTGELPGTNQRYLRYQKLESTRYVWVVEPTSIPPFAAELTTYAYPVSPDADRVNNVEGIVVESPEPGIWTVTVEAHNVPDGPQPYALVISGLRDEIPRDARAETVKPAYVPDSAITFQDAVRGTAKDLEKEYGIVDKEPVSNMRDLVMEIAPAQFQRPLASYWFALEPTRAVHVADLALFQLNAGQNATALTYDQYGEFKDGGWWMTDMAGTMMFMESTLAPGRSYLVRVVVQDGGEFDSDPQQGVVASQVVLVQPRTADSSSSSSGCNATGDAGFGPWFLACVLCPALAWAVSAARQRRRRLLSGDR